jgi:hypothetical protein
MDKYITHMHKLARAYVLSSTEDIKSFDSDFFLELGWSKSNHRGTGGYSCLAVGTWDEIVDAQWKAIERVVPDVSRTLVSSKYFSEEVRFVQPILLTDSLRPLSFSLPSIIFRLA